MARNSNLKWEVAAWAVSPDAAAANLVIPMAAFGTTTQDTLSVIDAGMLEGHDKEQLTLIRLVGCIRMATFTSESGSAGQAAAVKIRLHKGFEVSVDGLPITQFADPWDPNDAEEEFLWERTVDVGGIAASSLAVDWEQSIGVGGNPPARGDHPYWTEIDISLKRTVRPPEVLGLTFAPKGRSGDVLRVFAWLRALIAV